MQENNICRFLKKLRKSHNYSQKMLAAYLHIARQTYSHYETGRIIPPAKALYHLAKLYEIPVELFLELITDSGSSHDSGRVRQEGNMETGDVMLFSPKDISEPENNVDSDRLSEKERQMLSFYRLMDEREQNSVLHLLKGTGRGAGQKD